MPAAVLRQARCCAEGPSGGDHPGGHSALSRTTSQPPCACCGSRPSQWGRGGLGDWVDGDLVEDQLAAAPPEGKFMILGESKAAAGPAGAPWWPSPPRSGLLAEGQCSPWSQLKASLQQQLLWSAAASMCVNRNLLWAASSTSLAVSPLRFLHFW